MDCKYFPKRYQLLAIDLSKEIELENPELRKQINFIGKLEDDRSTISFIIEKSEETQNSKFKIFTKFCEYHIKWKQKRL